MQVSRILRWVPTLALLAVRLTGADAAIENRRHLYDGELRPVAATNPCLARVKPLGIEIPESELRAFFASEPPRDDKRGTLSLVDKRALLNRLLDEHFLLADAYRQKADESPGVARMLEGTLNMILEETLIAQEVAAKARSSEEERELVRAFRDRVFDETDVHVDNAAYEKLKAAAKRLASAPDSPSSGTAPGSAALPESLAPLGDQPLATCKAGVVTIGDVLQFYRQIPWEDRPDLDEQAALVAILRQIMTQALVVAEARERKLQESPDVQAKLQSNRNVLTRFYALDRLTDQAVARMKAPGHEERLRQWYATHLKDRYTVRTAAGHERVVSFEEERDYIENDYFDTVLEDVRREALRVLRRDANIEVNHDRLSRLVLIWPSSDPTELSGPAKPLPDAVQSQP